MENLILYVSVYFLNKPNKTYWYISDDYSVQIGDFVSVLVNDKIEICKIVSKCMYSKENTPYLFEQTKHIISKIDKATAIMISLCNKEETDSDFDDCGYYESGYILAKDLPIEINKDYFTFDKDNILGLSKIYDDYLFEHDSRDDVFVLPDGYKTAVLYYKNELGASDDGPDALYDGLDVKALIVPKGYEMVDLDETYIRQLFISNEVKGIIANHYFCTKCKTLYIPKDLKTIDFHGYSYDGYLFDYLQMSRIVIDKRNENFKLQNGVLYYLKDGHKYIMWISKHIKRLVVGENIDGVGFINPDVELEITSDLFFEKQEVYLRKRGAYSSIYSSPLHAFLGKFKAIIVGAINQKNYITKEALENLIVGDGKTTFNNIICKQSFLDKNEWIINGCITNEDFEKFSCFNDKSDDGFLGFTSRDTQQAKHVHNIAGLLEKEFTKSTMESGYKTEIFFDSLIEFDCLTNGGLYRAITWKKGDITSKVLNSVRKK